MIAQPKRKGLGPSPGAGRSHCMVSAVSVNLSSSRNCTCVAVSRRDEPDRAGAGSMTFPAYGRELCTCQGNVVKGF